MDIQTVKGVKNMFFGGEGIFNTVITGPGKVYIQFDGVNNRAKVLINGRLAGTHKGGYSAFRFEITDLLTSPKNFIEVEVDNSNHKEIYPDKADFTFYGGIYRDVKIIYGVPDVHFSLEDCATKGIYVTPKINGDVYVKALISDLSSSYSFTSLSLSLYSSCYSYLRR